MHSALLAAATSAVQQFTTGSVNPIEEFASVMTAASALRTGGDNTGDNALINQNLEAARRQIVEEAMSAMTGVIEKMVTAGGSAAYHRKALLCLQVRHTQLSLMFGYIIVCKSITPQFLHL